jgi:acyl carrier protein
LSTTQQARVGKPGPDDVFVVVRDAVATVLERDADTIARDSVLADLPVDSLGLVEVAEIVEEQLAPYARDLHIPDGDLEGFVTVGDAADFVLARL